VRFLARHPENFHKLSVYAMHRGKITRFALDMKVEGMPLLNPAVDGANDTPLPLLLFEARRAFFVPKKQGAGREIQGKSHLCSASYPVRKRL
jgi:hypothetical protein